MLESNAALARNNFPQCEEEKIIESLSNKHVEGVLNSGNRFWGTLDGFDENWLYLKGDRDQDIIVRRQKIAVLREGA